MNVRRFTARTSREALALLRQSLGDDAVVLSTKPCRDGVEVLAMAPEGLQQIERMSRDAPLPEAPRAPAAAPAPVTAVEDDVAALSMSTLSFQDYVRERMLKRRQAARDDSRSAAASPADARPGAVAPTTRPAAAARPVDAAEPALARAGVLEQRMSGREAPELSTPALRDPPLLRDEVRARAAAAEAEAYAPAPPASSLATHPLHASQRDDMLSELRSVRGLIEERFGALAYIEKLQRQPAQARLTQRLLDCGFSPALIRKLSESMSPDVIDETGWAASVLEHNLSSTESEAALEDQGGVYALIGSTGVGKTTSTAKLAAAFATKYGAGNLGLVTLDAYRVGAHEQLRAYGRILGVPVHTAHDRASLEDLLDLLSAKKLVLIDTAGMAQRDVRTRELLDMLQHRAIKKLLVVNAAAQGETVEDVLASYGVQHCHGVIVSKLDEAVKLGPALDALIRHKAKVVGVANGQRVPEDWHRLSAQALVQRALRGGGGASWRLDTEEVNLMFAATQGSGYPGPQGARASSLHA